MKSTHENYPVDWDDLLSRLLKGVQEAITDASQRNERHTAVQGKYEETGAAGSRYTFLLFDDWVPGTNAKVQIYLDSANSTQTVTGTILSTAKNSITLVTEIPLPETSLEKIVLVEDSAWMFERQQDSLARLQARGENEAHMASKLFDLCLATESYGTRQVQITTFVPNADQAKAIELGMESELLIVDGPPGSGKTGVESALIIELLLQGKTILLTAHTNQALDEVMKRLKQYCEHSDNSFLVKSHQLVRVGTPLNLTKETYQDITLQGIITQQLGELAHERDHLQQERDNLREIIAHHSTVLHSKQMRWEKERKMLQAQCETLRQKRAFLEQSEQQRLAFLTMRLAAIRDEQNRKKQRQREEEQAVQQADETLLAAQARQKKHEQALLAKRDELITLRARSLASRFFSQVFGKTEQILMLEERQCQEELKEAIHAVAKQKENKERALLQNSNIIYQITKIEEEERRHQEEQQMSPNTVHSIETLTAGLKEAERALQQGNIAIATLADNLSDLKSSSRRMISRLKEITNIEQSIELKVIKEARLIGTTLTGVTTKSFLRDRLFDVVLIDEASMASLVLVLVAAAHATRQIALFGDPHQLAPIIQLTDKKGMAAAAYWLGTDIFAYRRVTLEDADAGVRHVVFLSEQSRMLPTIATPLSQMVYGGRLKTRLNPQRVALQVTPHPEWPLMLIDTSDVDQKRLSQESRICQTKRPPRGTSKYNLYHIKCIIQLVVILLTQLPESGEPKIGVITPYRAQQIKIQRELQSCGLLSHVHVGTVYSFQSVEYPCMIFDTTEGFGVPIGKFTSDRWGHNGIPSAATRLLNVAHSRAQNKLIYIANTIYIRQDSYRKEHLLTKLVNYVAEQGCMNSIALFDQDHIEGYI